MEDIAPCESCWQPTQKEDLIRCWHCGLFVCLPCYKRVHTCEPDHHPHECKSLQLWFSGQTYRDNLRANSLQWARLRQPGYICKEEPPMEHPKTCRCNPASDKSCPSTSKASSESKAYSDNLTGLARWEDFAAQTVDSEESAPTSTITLTFKSEDPHLRIKAVHTACTADGQEIITFTLVRR